MRVRGNKERRTFSSLGGAMGFNRYHQNLFAGTSAGVISQYYTWHSTFPASANKLFSVKGRSLPIQRTFRIFWLPRPEVVFVTHTPSLFRLLASPTLSFDWTRSSRVKCIPLPLPVLQRNALNMSEFSVFWEQILISRLDAFAVRREMRVITMRSAFVCVLLKNKCRRRRDC